MLEQPASHWQLAERAPLQRSDLGLASFIQALIFAGLVALSFLVCIVAVAVEGGKWGDNNPLAIMVGLTMVLGMGIGVSGFGLGLVALFQAGRQRHWAMLGIALNGLGVLVMGGLIAIGCFMK